MKTYFVFDCESVGLHGETFAVGFVVVTENGEELYALRLSCPPDTADGDAAGRRWVKKNVPEFDHNCDNPWRVREAFMFHLARFRNTCAIFTDCGWPVEARFLLSCYTDKLLSGGFEGPYPLHDLASAILAAGGDPLETFDRKPNELPAHDPLADARQSARVLITHLRRIADPDAEDVERVTEDLKAGGVYFTTVLPEINQ